MRHSVSSRMVRKAALPALLMSGFALAGCAATVPPEIQYDSATPAVRTVDPPAPVTIVKVPAPLPLPGQLKPVTTAKSLTQPASPTLRVTQANAAARVQPEPDGFLNAVQVYPFSGGALYQVYTASGPVAAGDTVRWIIGDTESGSGPTKKIHILVKPTRPNLVTNLVINTDRRTYLLELRSTAKTYMASVSWSWRNRPRPIWYRPAR